MKNNVFWSGFILVAVIFVSNSLGQVPAPYNFRLQPYLSGLSSPVLVTNARDGTRRLFVVQQGGTIRVVQPGSTTHTEFMNITSRVLSGGERGLLGLTFHPDFENNHYFFVNYTRQTDGATVIARFTAINNNSVGDPNSERILLTIPQPFSNHNGGMIEFGPDNNLYIGMGDGGSGNDPGNRAQNINELLGKFLRITPDVSGSPTAPAYTNPPDNPFVGVNGADEIYAVGVRNPFRFSFDRGGTNQLWAGDVGQGALEEVSIITLGGNFGWRVYEGTNCTGLDPSLCVPANFIPPVLVYANAGSPRCSVTGGYVYRGPRNAFPQGSYIYGDFCTGEILLWHNNAQLLLQDTSRSISSFGEDEDGELYVVGLGGTVDKILGNETSADFDGDLRTDISVYRPTTSTFFVLNSSDASHTSVSWGSAGDMPVPEDYDGDNKTDVAVFRPSTGEWLALRSSDGTVLTATWGGTGDIPVANDYDGDGKADVAVYRPSNGTWSILRSSNSSPLTVVWGTSTDLPVARDYDADGRADITVYRPSTGTWYRLNSSNATWNTTTWGAAGDLAVPADFDGDTLVDIAVYRPSTGFWYILQSTNFNLLTYQWGSGDDIPTPGDYDNDGEDDIAVWRPSNGTWYVLRSSNASYLTATWGSAGDVPLPPIDTP